MPRKSILGDTDTASVSGGKSLTQVTTKKDLDDYLTKPISSLKSDKGLQEKDDLKAALTNKAASKSYEDADSYMTNVGDVDVNTQKTVSRMITNSLTGIEGMPYQFPSTVDRRITGDEKDRDNYSKLDGVGRKFGEKIMSRFPFLFITPCTAEFMKGFSQEDKKTTIDKLLTNTGDDVSELITGQGKYYSIEFAYAQYYNYLNLMLNTVAIYLGLHNTKVKINGKKRALGTMDWSKEANSDFKTFFSAAENLIFYVDGFSSVSHSFSNDTGDSSLASTINGFADQINELKFLLGTGDSAAKSVASMSTDVTSTLSSSISKLSSSIGSFGGSVVDSLAQNGVMLHSIFSNECVLVG